MSTYIEYTIVVPVEAVDTDDWRDDPRFDDLLDRAQHAFAGFDVDAVGRLVRVTPPRTLPGHDDRPRRQP